jgi:hypothetical protein
VQIESHLRRNGKYGQDGGGEERSDHGEGVQDGDESKGRITGRGSGANFGPAGVMGYELTFYYVRHPRVFSLASVVMFVTGESCLS